MSGSDLTDIFTRYHKLLMVLLGVGFLSACATAPTRSPSEPRAVTDSKPVRVEALASSRTKKSSAKTAAISPIAHIAERALSALGVRYRYGGNTPKEGFDCSGFVRWVYQELAANLPRSALALSQVEAPQIDPQALTMGDLLFFRIQQSARISHVGIYVGDGKFIHAPKPGQHVRIESLDTPWWRKRFALARRWTSVLPTLAHSK